MPERDTPIIGFSAKSGTGKTTLLVNIIPIFKKKGLRIGVIKHAHHNFEIDQPGKDSYQLRKAGAEATLIGSKKRWALMVENNGDRQRRQLSDYIKKLNSVTLSGKLDVILVEGFKLESIPKIVLHRPSLGEPYPFEDNDNIIAVASDEKYKEGGRLSILDLNDHEKIVDCIIKYIKDRS